MPFIEELKKHKNKPLQRFACEVIERTTDSLILRYWSAVEGRMSDIAIPAGSTTVGFYWQKRGFVLWRMYAAEGTLLGSLFHICRDTTISETQVSYLDLILDIWISPDGTVRILDEDELAACRASGLLSSEEAQWIDQVKGFILKEYAQLLAEAADAEGKLPLLTLAQP